MAAWGANELIVMFSSSGACKQIDRIFDECVAKVTKMKEELEGDQGIEDPWVGSNIESSSLQNIINISMQ